MIIYNTELEKDIIWCILQDTNYFYDISTEINIDDFYCTNHKKIWTEMLSWNFDTFLLNNVYDWDIYEDILSWFYINANMWEKIKKIKELSTIRKIQKKIKEYSFYVQQDMHKEAINAIKNIDIDHISEQSYQKWDVVLQEFFEKEAQEEKINIDSVMNSIIWWFAVWQLIIVWARPSVWKSAFAVNLAVDNINSWYNVWFIWLEMTNKENLVRFIKCMSWNEKIRNQETKELVKDKLKNLCMYDSSWDIEKVKNQIKKMVIKDNVKVVYIDYLQILQGNGTLWKNFEISEITRDLKCLAQEQKIVIFLLSQLNRKIESRIIKTPILSDLRDSGSIEQDANKVIMLHRESIYDRAEEWRDKFEIHIVKNREHKNWEFEFDYDLSKMKIYF